MCESLNLPTGYRVIALDTVDSTNDELKRRASSNSEDEGLAIWSRIQTAGKGRNQRRWVSDIGNMYISVLFRPNCSLPDAAQLGFLPVIAASKTLEHLLRKTPDISYKWPNDLLLNKKKVGGTLLEAGFYQKTKTIWVAVGFGLNIQNFPSTAYFPATSIKDEMGEDLKIEEVVELYLQNLSELYSSWQEMGFEPVRKEWLSRGHGINEPLRVKLGVKNLFGLFRDLDKTGALVIDTSKGSHRVSAGDVYLLPLTGEF